MFLLSNIFLIMKLMLWDHTCCYELPLKVTFALLHFIFHSDVSAELLQF